jgi:hypothetical protein
MARYRKADGALRHASEHTGTDNGKRTLNFVNVGGMTATNPANIHFPIAKLMEGIMAKGGKETAKPAAKPADKKGGSKK